MDSAVVEVQPKNDSVPHPPPQTKPVDTSCPEPPPLDQKVSRKDSGPPLPSTDPIEPTLGEIQSKKDDPLPLGAPGCEATDEAACLQELSDTEYKYGPYSLRLSTVLRKLGGLYQNTGESTNYEMLLERTLASDERTSGRLHNDTITTCFDLAEVYIQHSKLTEALIVLQGIAESCKKLGTGTDVERRRVVRMGLKFRERNLHNEAVDVLERAYEGERSEHGDTFPSSIGMGKILSFSYLQQFYQQSLRKDRPKHQCVVNLAKLCRRMLKAERGPIWPLGLMCLWSNDGANASYAFKQPTNGASCDVCKERIQPRTRWLACSTCLYMFVCNDCYEKWLARTDQSVSLTDTCAGHPFHIIGVKGSNQVSRRGLDDDEEVDLWLSGLIDQKTKQATAVDFLNYWESIGKPEELQEFSSSVYYYESDSLPAHVDEVKTKVTLLDRIKWRRQWATTGVPTLLGLFFTSKGQLVRMYSFF